MTNKSTIKKKPKIKHLKIKTEKAKAWKAFSEFIRRSYTEGDTLGFIVCYTCNTPLPWKQMQCGHGIGGRNNAVLFLEEVCRPQCVGCNVFGGGKYPIFTSKLIKELGMEEYDRILTLSQQTVKFTALDYHDIYENYKQKLEDLK